MGVGIALKPGGEDAWLNGTLVLYDQYILRHQGQGVTQAGKFVK